jgi:hypothetical protein
LWKTMSSDLKDIWMSTRKCSQIWRFKIRNDSFWTQKRNVNKFNHSVERNNTKISKKRQMIRNTYW